MGVLRIACFAAVWVAVCLLVSQDATAQVGLGDVLATQAAGQELEGNRARAAADAKNKAEEALGAEEEAPGESAESDVEAEELDANEPVNQQALDKWNDEHSIPRFKEPSVSWWKLTFVLVLLLIWMRVADWINRDVNEFELGYELWSAVAVFPAMLAGAVLVFVPIFWAGFGLLAAAVFGPLIAYALKHNQSVESHQKVFTADWFRFTMAETLGKVGIKIKTNKQAGYMAGAPVELIATGGDERVNQANLLVARQSPGFVLVKDLIAEMVGRGSGRVMLDYTQQGVAVRHLIDGVWHNGESKELDAGNVLLAVMKQLSNLDAKDRRSKQSGAFAAEYQSAKYTCPLQSQGTKTGERVVLSVAGGTEKKFKTYADLGMRPKVAEEWSAVMAESTGLIVFSAMPEGGLTTLTNVSLQETDRLMRDFISVEEKSSPEIEMENIEQVFYDAAAGETPGTLVPKLIRKYPDVYVVRDFVDADSAKQLMEQATDGKLIITSTPARDAAESLVRVCQCAPPKEVAETALGAIGTKLIRLLCTECRVGFEPSPDLLKKLGIPAGKVELLYREPKADEIDKPCKACGGIGFRGRTALHEVLLPDENVREVLMKKPKPDVVRKAARAAGMRTFQEEGILLIAKGATSLSELQRVLKA